MFQGRSESVAPSRESSSAILSRGWTAISNINTINSSYSVDSRPEPWFLINETVLSASGGGALSETRPTSHPTSKNTSGNFHQVAGKCCERQVESSHRSKSSLSAGRQVTFGISEGWRGQWLKNGALFSSQAANSHSCHQLHLW
ncbi:hypothetical protein DTO027B5_4414 [Paecilomyces variotii]|nr:hypothetical protein DTO169C6_1455 [Paecilomyces variotii]KAJ9266476.1 hypothetical protein DTO195F2_999 [Paecilomyces variotii]KAJ9283755.1 hypothetical protein DTO021C3_8686 [Paecilomyces variotii]KAJ9329286.1 hypothetical protein DTO027B3_686 [Paecilomyces variotii]KAJ9333845.1 hypothetical protein DTO027B5_4414 [Paecilomyces variotii]